MSAPSRRARCRAVRPGALDGREQVGEAARQRPLGQLHDAAQAATDRRQRPEALDVGSALTNSVSGALMPLACAPATAARWQAASSLARRRAPRRREQLVGVRTDEPAPRQEPRSPVSRPSRGRRWVGRRPDAVVAQHVPDRPRLRSGSAAVPSREDDRSALQRITAVAKGAGLGRSATRDLGSGCRGDVAAHGSVSSSRRPLRVTVAFTSRTPSGTSTATRRPSETSRPVAARSPSVAQGWRTDRRVRSSTHAPGPRRHGGGAPRARRRPPHGGVDDVRHLRRYVTRPRPPHRCATPPPRRSRRPRARPGAGAARSPRTTTTCARRPAARSRLPEATFAAPGTPSAAATDRAAAACRGRWPRRACSRGPGAARWRRRPRRTRPRGAGGSPGSQGP